MAAVYHRLLLHGARITQSPRFDPLHHGVRAVYRRLVVPALAAACRSAVGPLRLEIRHSAKAGAGFNLFLSDLDLSVFLDEVTDAKLAAIRALVTRWRRVLPFIGELEIYSTGEAAELDRWRAGSADVYAVLRNLRKIVWLEIAYREARTDYHRDKALRGIQRCLRLGGVEARARPDGNAAALGDVIAGFLAGRFAAPGDPGEIRAFCPYLGVEVAELGLPAPLALVLLAITPPVRRGDARVAELRREPTIRRTWRALTEMEVILFRASDRSFSERRAWTAAWRAMLDEALSAARQA